MNEPVIPAEMRDLLRAQWHSFVDRTSDLRPGLHAYACLLTADLWQAEALVQAALGEVFATLAQVDDEITNVRVLVYRGVTRLWMASSGQSKSAARRTALEHLECSLGAGDDELAAILQTCVEGVRKLRGGAAVQCAADDSNAATLFCDLYNTGDREGLLALTLENAMVGNIGTDVQWGREGHRSRYSWFDGSLGGHPEWPRKFRFESQRAQVRTFCGKPVVLVFRTRRGEEALENVIHIDAEAGRIGELRSYSFCPQTIAAVAAHFDLNVRTGGYRYPTPEPAGRY